MNGATHLEHRASSSQSKHEGEPSFALCDRLSRTRDNSQRQLPTDHDYAVPTREYQTDQSSLKTAPAAAGSVFGKRKRNLPKQSHRSRPVDTVTPYQGNTLDDREAMYCRQYGTFAHEFPDCSQCWLALVYGLGSIPIRSLTADRMRCRDPRYCSVV